MGLPHSQGDEELVELRPGLSIRMADLVELCEHHGVRHLAVFGSVLKNTFTDGSDIDVLVEFSSDRTVGFLEIAAFELELSKLVQDRDVEIRTLNDLSPHFRDDVRSTARELYAAA